MAPVKKHYHSVFVSPHLDDAVFACGGLIAALQDVGPILVLNVFTHYPEDFRKGAVVISRARHDEERAAADFLGFDYHNLDLVDAPMRLPAYRSPAALFRPAPPDDPATPSYVRRRLEDYLSETSYSRLYLPLGIGWHVDHVVVYEAMRHKAREDDVWFYEDAPYCLIPMATGYRLRELGIPHETDSSLRSRGLLRDFFSASKAYSTMAPIMSYGAWPKRVLASAVVSAYIYGLLREHASRPQTSDAGWVSEKVSLGDRFETKIAACTKYGSQFREFFLSRLDCEMRFRAYSDLISPVGDERSSGGAVERFWRSAQ